MNVVMWVAIVLNQSTSVLIAGEFDRIWVDGVDWREEGLSIVHYNGRFVVVGGSSKLWVGLRVDVGVATDNGQIYSMGAASVPVIDLGLVLAMVVVWIVVRWLLVVSIVVSPVVSIVVSSVVLVVRYVDIIVGVAIVWDQSASSFVASKFDFIGIDMIDRGNNWLAINLDNGLMWRNSGGSELWVNIPISLDVTSGDSKFDTMGALWFTVISAVAIALTVVDIVATVVVVTCESITIMQLGLAAGQDALTCVVHLRCESKLLAVENESVTIGIQLRLGPDALFAASSDFNVCVKVSLMIDFVVQINIILISTDSCAIVGNLIFNGVDIIAQVVD